MLTLFDPEVGRRLRALLTLGVSVLVAVIALAQGVLDVLDVLPDWEYLGVVALFLRGAITVLTQWTTFGNQSAAAAIDYGTGLVGSEPRIIPRPRPATQNAPDYDPTSTMSTDTGPFPPSSPEAG